MTAKFDPQCRSGIGINRIFPSFATCGKQSDSPPDKEQEHLCISREKFGTGKHDEHQSARKDNTGIGDKLTRFGHRIQKERCFATDCNKTYADKQGGKEPGTERSAVPGLSRQLR